MVGLHGFAGKALLINDLDLIKQIFIKDADHFLGKGGFTDLGTPSLNAMLFVLEGETWRETRHASTPVFTSGKLKKMSRLINKVSVARWQNFIPSFSWIGPEWRVLGCNPRKGRDQILQHSDAEL